jgi:ubiquinone biosynthesis protein
METAKPWLERWMSEQIGWRGLIRSFKEEAPRYASILPHLPRLLHQRLIENPTAGLENLMQSLLVQQQRRNTLLTVIAGVLLLLTGWLLVGWFSL